jgi:hypothetical protein
MRGGAAAMPYAPAMSQQLAGRGLGVVPGRLWRRGVLAVAAVGALLFVWWFVTTPPALPTREGHVTAVTTVGKPVFVGVWSTGSDFGRELHVAGVRLRADATVAVDLEPLLCRGGSVGVTSDPAPFCRELLDPAGTTLGPGDSLVVRVVAEEPGAVYLDRPSLAFREGPRWGNREAGTEAVLAIVTP